MRYAVAIGVIAVAFATAVFTYQLPMSYTTANGKTPGWRAVPSATGAASRYYEDGLDEHRRTWRDPVAVLIAIGGIAVAVGIVAYRNPRFTST
jgi:hypothetical protein